MQGETSKRSLATREKKTTIGSQFLELTRATRKCRVLSRSIMGVESRGDLYKVASQAPGTGVVPLETKISATLWNFLYERGCILCFGEHTRSLGEGNPTMPIARQLEEEQAMCSRHRRMYGAPRADIPHNSNRTGNNIVVDCTETRAVYNDIASRSCWTYGVYLFLIEVLRVFLCGENAWLVLPVAVQSAMCKHMVASSVNDVPFVETPSYRNRVVPVYQRVSHRDYARAHG